MSYDRGTYTDDRIVADADQLGAGCFEHGVVTDPDVLSQLHPAAAMQPDTNTPGSRHEVSQQLEQTIFQTSYRTFHTCLLTCERTSRRKFRLVEQLQDGRARIFAGGIPDKGVPVGGP